MPNKLQARALWITKPHHSELKPAEVRPCGPNDITVKAIASGISHGTEMVLYRGQGPAGQKLTPITSEGSWTLPAKFGYQNVGRVIESISRATWSSAVIPTRTISPSTRSTRNSSASFPRSIRSMRCWPISPT
jgi:hypothetical protein